MTKEHKLFCYSTEPPDAAGGALADALRERLRAIRIDWDEVTSRNDVEAVVPDPASLGKWTVEFRDASSVGLYVSAPDSDRAAAVLTELRGQPATLAAPAEVTPDEERQRLRGLEDEARRMRRRDELGAMRLYEECERAYRAAGDKSGLLRVLEGIAFLLDGIPGMEAATDSVNDECAALARELEP